MKKVLAAILAMASINAFAADSYVSGATIAAISVRANNVFFAVSGVTPSNVCNHWGYEFNLDISTTGGKNLYAALLMAKANDLKVNLTYVDSSQPGTNQCPGSTVARPWVIDIQ